ncbi:2-C-methyl-D-erythritol 2,4-cyclodiphosphate synthase [Bifidobacterium crudilactis]|jgi:2-C-methyl-D-erythritol 2,4-cyclodiphosphate synthase|uniref:2-C-methyl-D-erythritol 2,4-cyclodiphosphate synthase n=1 Tax=Bifidobacterium crudilactis TaxID=327277 RepID=UPI002353C62C|nr:2-C-methyl-D-erythritol 2,4-cyclodiphosphate synthase [Bifidobacterium crudilactis]MCI1867732.1 2-C-methyl-D-erythritol 2,4-cyclodiphosphate synthase [Bifidobacterium crudilactis]
MVENSGAGISALRVGMGFDAHRFAAPDEQRELWLACMRWEDAEGEGVSGLSGDSDGDVVAHAVIDALLSASNQGDIGSFFGVGPTSKGSGMHGRDMIREIAIMLAGRGWSINGASVVVVTQQPNISTRRQEAEMSMSQALGAPVTLTASTTDGMGFTGHGEGMAAMATATLIRQTTL